MEGLIECLGPIDDIVNDYARVDVDSSGHSKGRGNLLPVAINIMDHHYKCGWAICWAKQHYIISPFDGIWALER